MSDISSRINKASQGYPRSKDGLNTNEFKLELIKLYPSDENKIIKMKRKEVENYYNFIIENEDKINSNLNLNSNSNVIVLIGYPGSGKSTYANSLVKKDNSYVIISRDIEGGTISSLIPKIDKELNKGNKVIIDNTNLTKDTREIFEKYNPEYIYIESTIYDCQIRILHRMYQKYNKIFMMGINPDKTIKDPNVFPPAVLFAARKNLELPDKYIKIVTPEFKFPNNLFTNKGLFLDIDGTLRKTDHLVNKYPISEDEIEPAFNLNKMKQILKSYIDNGYILIGVSNQSGIDKKIVTEDTVIKCFNKTKEMLSLDFPIYYCPHQSIPIVCYCRKPQSGNVVLACETYNINPINSIFIGDKTTDKTTAERLNMKFIFSNKFFN
jgi:HAD superfamily hydrolase (TIGR01662 family)